MITSYSQVNHSDFFDNLYSKRNYSYRKTQRWVFSEKDNFESPPHPKPRSSETLPLQITTFQWFGIGHFSKEGECFESNVFETP